jgi:hypothetical protein
LQAQPALLVPNVSLGNDQSGRYVLVVNKDGVVVQRKVEPGHLVGNLRVIEKGLTKDDHVVVGGIKHAIPGQKVDAELGSAAAANWSSASKVRIIWDVRDAARYPCGKC